MTITINNIGLHTVESTEILAFASIRSDSPNLLNNMENEIWKEVIGFSGYFVSNLGRVKSERQKHIILKNRTIGKVKANTYYLPYQQVVLYENSTQKNKMIHRLVAEAFIPNPENKKQVHHKDNNVLNNRVDNLEWVTPSENVNYTLPYRKETYGEANNKSKLTNNKVIEIRSLYSTGYFTQRELASLFKVSQPAIKSITKNQTWKQLITNKQNQNGSN